MTNICPVASRDCGTNRQGSVAYELEDIESKITENISLAASGDLTFDVPEFFRQLDQECSKVKRAFRQQVVSFENERLVKRYFHFHQESLIDLIDTLSTEQQLKHPFLQSILDRLAGLLNYLEEHFPDYFNQDMKMPVIYGPTIRKELDEFRALLLERFRDTATDVSLIDLLKASLDVYLNTKGSLTFRQFYYLKLLRLNIEGIEVSGPEFATIDLIRVLMHCNFNSESFYAYVLKYMSHSIEVAESLGDRLELLIFYLKFANQEASNHAIAFNHQYPPISVQVADWLSQEVMYLKTKQQLMSVASAEDIVPSEFRLQFNLSVSQLALLFRAFIETGVIQNKNTSELLRFLAKYVKTKRSENISYESFRIKYYSIEAGTKDAVKKTLQSMLTFIGKN